VAEAVRSRLLAMPYPTALALIQDPADVRRRDAAPRMDPNHAAGDIPPILGMPDGEVVIRGPSQESAGWSDSLNRVGAGGGTFFEVDLIRNVALSPVARDGLAPYVAFTMRVRWPAFRFSPDGPMGVDPGEMDVLFLGGAILR
ncbi:MAG: hypothetical protein WD941_03845, partial [Opitutus sp.]